MQIKRLTVFIILIQSLFIFESEAQETKIQMTQYYYISVDFYSIGQGIDIKAQEELFGYINKTQKKFKEVLYYERNKWGKEGEETIYIDIRNIPIEERQNFLNNLYNLFRDRTKMAIVHSNLFFEPSRQNLILGISLYGQFETRENALLDYIAKWERHSRFKINPGNMINETAIPEDQDRRNELNLSGLEKDEITEIVEKAQKIMEVVLPNLLEVDFSGIGGSNDRAFKGYLKAYITKFEEKNKVKIQFDTRIYTFNNGGELFSIQLYNLKDNLKKEFIHDVNKLFADVNYIILTYN